MRESCPQCGSTDMPTYLGIIGTREYNRCRACESDYSDPLEDDDEEEDDRDFDSRDFDDSMDGDFDSDMASAGFGMGEDYGGDMDHY